MLADSALRERCATKGKAHVHENYSWDVVARKTYDFIQQALAENQAFGNLQCERLNRAPVRTMKQERENVVA
jgi:hypothetical protein